MTRKFVGADWVVRHYGYDPYNTADVALNIAACNAKRAGFRGPPLQTVTLVVSTPVAYMLKAVAAMPPWYIEKLRRSNLYGKFVTTAPARR